jgi:uncharacterized protein
LKNGLIIFLLLCLVSIGCKKADKTYYDTGELKELINVDDNGNRHGEYKRFDIDGVILETGQYEDGFQIGKKIIFYEKNLLEQESEYKEGEMHGMHKVYFKNGKLKTQATYQRGELNGPFKQFYEDGSIKEVLNFDGGEENGPFEEYYKSGKLKWQGTYYNGKEVSKLTLFDEQGTILKTMEYDSMGLGVTTYRKPGYVDPVAYE